MRSCALIVGADEMRDGEVSVKFLRKVAPPLEAAWQVCPYCEAPIAPADVASFPMLGTPRAHRRSK